MPLQKGTEFFNSWKPPLIFSLLRCSDRMWACLRDELLVDEIVVGAVSAMAGWDVVVVVVVAVVVVGPAGVGAGLVSG